MQRSGYGVLTPTGRYACARYCLAIENAGRGSEMEYIGWCECVCCGGRMPGY